MSEWTVRKKKPEQSPGARFVSYAFGVVLLGAVGAGLGAALPMIVGFGGTGRRSESFAHGVVQNQVRRDARETAIRDTKGSMAFRAVVGLLIGAAGGGLLIFRTEQARLKRKG
ncbi:MAG: hypothetical protein JKY65_15270 [Planctomycetes bacterium]|nr:hypothetical protein [Planctomycetota bacterium]